jgi:hypothetical protein
MDAAKAAAAANAARAGAGIAGLAGASPLGAIAAILAGLTGTAHAPEEHPYIPPYLYPPPNRQPTLEPEDDDIECSYSNWVNLSNSPGDCQGQCNYNCDDGSSGTIDSDTEGGCKKPRVKKSEVDVLDIDI